MYHFLSPTGAAGAAAGVCDASSPPPPDCSVATPVSVVSSGAAELAIHELRQVRPQHVEQPEDDGRDDRHDDDDHRGGADFFRGRPGDLLELAGDFVREGVDAIVAVESDA